MSRSAGMEVWKLSGAGNDFIALVEPRRMPTPEEIRSWCQRGISMGADGVLVLKRSDHGARLTHFNSDGGQSKLCINGSRCAAQLAFTLEWVDDELELATDAGILQARRAGLDEVEIDLPGFSATPRETSLAVGDDYYDGWHLGVGVEHFVLPWPEGLANAPVATIGPILRSHPDLGDEGANIDFVRFVGGDRFEIRTFERGVEAETLACGSGVVAAAAVGLYIGELEPPMTGLTAGGFSLRVDGERLDRQLRRATITGDARVVARGELLPGAAARPRPPHWS